MKIICDATGIRIDAYLSEKTGKSRNFVKDMLENGLVTVNGKKVKASNKTKENDEIEYELPEEKEAEIIPQDIDLDIVYEDSDVLVINKPVGMVVHPAPGNYEDTLVNAIMFHCRDKLSTINSVVRPGIVHRIDKDTSGLLVVAKNDNAHNSLAEQFKVHSVTREYTAIVKGSFKSAEGTVDAPIGRHPVDRKKMAVTAKNSKHAVTHFKVVEQLNGYTLVKCRLETGRTHQIRVHMNYIGHTLLGDVVYGDKNKLGIKHQMLHAGILGFVHPSTGKYMEFSIPLPEEFENILEKIKYPL